MRDVDLLVTVASWEPRFVRGLERILGRYRPTRLFSYYLREYREETRAARERIGELARPHGTRLVERQIAFSSPRFTWRTLESDLLQDTEPESRVLLDLTTMPREVIWTALFWLEASRASVEYIYNRPEAYSHEWLARDPREPRLLYKLSGELELGRPTALVAVTGFDVDRCRQAIDFFEPATVLLATQIGDQFANAQRNIAPDLGAGLLSLQRLEIDAYSSDHGYQSLREHVRTLARGHNVVLCSFGPKPSAIALFRLQREHPQCALAFITCNEYSQNYSEGLGATVEGHLDWRR